VPVVTLSSRRELDRLFRAAGFSQVCVHGRHLPTNRLPATIRPRVDRWAVPLERRVGWYWLVDAKR
jgi:hypothetical protein